MSELSYEASDEASENELLERSLSVWRGWSSIREDFTPIPLDIHTASSIGQYECVRNLITRGEVEIDRKNVGGWTPLMYACYIGHDHIVGLLIDTGCNVNLKNQRAQTPLMLAASCGNESVGRILLRKGAELEAADRNGWTALFHATYSGHQNFVAFLLDQHANMDAVEPSTGMTPFMEAASEGHEIIVQLFLQHGVNVNAKTYNGDTARSLALICGHMKIVSLIDNHMLPHTALRSEPGLESYLSSSDETDRRQRPLHQRGSRGRSKGPSIRDGPEAIARMIDKTRAADQVHYQNLVVPRGYLSFPRGDSEYGETQLSFRDVTSPINQEDYILDSSGGKDSFDYNDDSNAFSKTGAITIKSSSSSSGGLIAALGLSRQNSDESDHVWLHDSGVHNSSQSEDSADPAPLADLVQRPQSRRLISNDPSCKTPSQDGKVDDVSSAETLGASNKKCSPADQGGELTSHVQTVCERNSPGVRSERGRTNREPLTTKPCADVYPAGESCEKFPIQFGDVVFPDVLQHVMCVPGSAESHSLKDSSNAAKTGKQVSSVHLGAVGVQWNKLPDVGMLPSAPGCLQLSDQSSRAAYTQRRSSCQARLSRPACGAEQEPVSVSSEGRLRRRSANSPPRFHRDSATAFQPDCVNQGVDGTHGVGRVSCLSDTPFSASPVAGYFVASSAQSSGPFLPFACVAETGIDGIGTKWVSSVHYLTPVAAVAPTYVDAVHASSTSHTSSAAYHQLVPHSAENASSSCSSQITSETSAPVSMHLHSQSFCLSVDSATGQGGSHDMSSALGTMSSLRRELPGGCEDGGDARGQDCGLEAVLEQLGLGKYAAIFSEQDVDLQVFLSLTDNDLKEIGIKLFGPRKKMTNAIARWHSQAPAARSSLEQAYADRLEGEMQELAIQLNQAYDSVEKLRAQVLQEQQLRSVTESCLMEERATWQNMRRTLVDARHHCCQLGDALNNLTSCQTQMKERLDQVPSVSSGMNSNRDVRDPRNEVPAVTLLQLSRLSDQHLHDVRQHHDVLTRSISCLIGHSPATGLTCEDRHVNHEFP